MISSLSSSACHIPSSELMSDHDRDLRTRTLTSLLAALSPVTQSLPSNKVDITGTTSSWDNTCPSDNTSSQERLSRDSNKTWLKFLNHVAQLLVREHEIVAIIPQRTGPTARISLLVATDSSSDDDDVAANSSSDDYEVAVNSSTDDDHRDSITGYLITQNPRFNSHSPSSGNPIGKLVDICSHQDMVQYFNTYRHVSFRNHVLSIEVLYNRIVDAWGTYTKVLEDSDSGFTAISLQEARDDLVLRRNLLNSFVTFYSLRKMHRRFHSAPLAGFNAGMTGMSQAQVELAFERATIPDDQRLFTASEMSVFVTLLGECAVNAYPGLSAAVSDAHAKGTLVSYTKETAWDLHRLLLFALDRAQVTVDTLYTQIISASTLPLNFPSNLSKVQYAMSRLHFLVYHCPAISAHMKSIEFLISAVMAPKPANMMSPKPTIAPFTSDLDQDGGASDTTIEISLAYQEKRVGEECLWLAVRYQAALESLMEDDALPTERVTLSLCDVSIEDGMKNELHDWKSVMRSIYPSANPVNDNISCDEAIQTLEEWAKRVENRVRATHILRKSSHEFSGCWHAEALLGTLRHLSKLKAQTTTHPAVIDLAPFKRSFGSIGVSKRCCPVCTKLLSLLATAPHDCSSTVKNHPFPTCNTELRRVFLVDFGLESTA
ncbi:hypothetical protein L211DRAFT_854467 [Terfezia boudieri ATCC MYA-4762]|uniref:Uncharacterized protein n=1 Tax=Terfezia boudieri ATCC MYA-4762 TaxID=1051890 RepID=A0A3N4LBT1_9PEZI|nr:hypothetical protein L211DRAFT_854467 [Terfezia boudieri ATCC MYA-4762]